MREARRRTGSMSSSDWQRSSCGYIIRQVRHVSTHRVTTIGNCRGTCSRRRARDWRCGPLPRMAAQVHGTIISCSTLRTRRVSSPQMKSQIAFSCRRFAKVQRISSTFGLLRDNAACTKDAARTANGTDITSPGGPMGHLAPLPRNTSGEGSKTPTSTPPLPPSPQTSRTSPSAPRRSRTSAASTRFDRHCSPPWHPRQS